MPHICGRPVFATVTGFDRCIPPGKLAELVWWWSNWEEGGFGLKEDSPGVGGQGRGCCCGSVEGPWMGEQERRGAWKSGEGGCGTLETEYVIFLKKDPSG